MTDDYGNECEDVVAELRACILKIPWPALEAMVMMSYRLGEKLTVVEMTHAEHVRQFLQEHAATETEVMQVETQKYTDELDALRAEVTELRAKLARIPWELIFSAMMIAAPTHDGLWEKFAPLNEWYLANCPEEAQHD